ncbi:hypothetical protein KNJ79_19595 [Sphingopyxis indica]|uniref:hypothetical protein n=1 Tax=Sphingopyxis indica TaxID=436663 RepID=UPI0029392952|nr:hypothetical protein [Sphingopyxis indica]WOF43280.1 hypothetical protein KNJ79_19595 [Sphingopyxis indica]
MPNDVANVDRAKAVALMREALDLLDRAGRSEAAIYLQHAIDTVERRPVMGSGDPLDLSLIGHILGPLDVAPRGHHLRVRKGQAKGPAPVV